MQEILTAVVYAAVQTTSSFLLLTDEFNVMVHWAMAYKMHSDEEAMMPSTRREVKPDADSKRKISGHQLCSRRSG